MPTPRIRRSLALVVTLVLFTVACSADNKSEAPAGIFPSAGLDVAVVLTGLTQPTQFYVEASGNSVLIAEIIGGENDGMGRVSRVALPPLGESRVANHTVLFDNLAKPTGLARFDDQIWIMQEDRLTRGPDQGGTLSVVLGDLPSNGRSQGTLTATDDALLYDVSGRKVGKGDALQITEGSGRLFALSGSNGSYESTELASGFKHAYAHVIDEAGQLWTTEMTDGLFDNEPGTDEVVAVTNGADHGWPHCVDDNRPVTEYNGTADRCASVPGSLATLGVGATPTSIVVSPWDPAELLVALWNRGEVVAVRTDAPNSEPRVLIRGLDNPQHLVVAGDGLLVTEFGVGRLLSIRSH